MKRKFKSLNTLWTKIKIKESEEKHFGMISDISGNSNTVLLPGVVKRATEDDQELPNKLHNSLPFTHG